MNKPKVTELDIDELLDILEDIIRCNHYCPFDCNHNSLKYSKYDIIMEIKYRDLKSNLNDIK